MATAWKIHIDPDNTGLLNVRQTDEAARKATELLQQDLETHHVFFNDMGFHNHIAHHILSLYGTGASAPALQAGYDANAAYQRPALPPAAPGLQSWAQAKAALSDVYFGNQERYPYFLAFFQGAAAAAGWQAALAAHLFAGTADADDLLARLFAGALHPLIQLLCGMEWRQPALVAAALAQACVHPPYLKGLLLRAEAAARAAYGTTAAAAAAGTGAPRRMPRIVALLEEVRGEEKIRTAVRAAHLGQEGVDDLMERAPEELMRILGKVQVRPEELEERTAEMLDVALFAAAGASFRPGKMNKFDFFLIHHVNSAPIFLTINAQPWIPVETKARVLEWKIRYDILQYAARAAPALLLDQLKAYQPKTGGNTSISEALSRLHAFRDDGHAIKLSRAALITQNISKKYEDRDWMMIKGDDVWVKIQHLIADSVEAPGPKWLRTAGVDEAWNDVPDSSNL